MTIQFVTPETIRLGTGGVKSFTFDFKIDSEDELFVTVNGVQKVFTLTLNPDQKTSAGGNVVLVDAPDAGTEVRIYRDTDITQETAYPDYDKFPASSHERALDKITMILQELWASLGNLWNRAILFPERDPLKQEVPSVRDRAGKYFFWDSEGRPTVTERTDSDPSKPIDAGTPNSLNDFESKLEFPECINWEWIAKNLGIQKYSGMGSYDRGYFSDNGAFASSNSEIATASQMCALRLDSFPPMPNNDSATTGIKIGGFNQTGKVLAIANSGSVYTFVCEGFSEIEVIGTWYLSSSTDVVLAPSLFDFDENDNDKIDVIQWEWIYKNLGIQKSGMDIGTLVTGLYPSDNLEIRKMAQFCAVDASAFPQNGDYPNLDNRDATALKISSHMNAGVFLYLDGGSMYVFKCADGNDRIDGTWFKYSSLDAAKFALLECDTAPSYYSSDETLDAKKVVNLEWLSENLGLRKYGTGCMALEPLTDLDLSKVAQTAFVLIKGRYGTKLSLCGTSPIIFSVSANGDLFVYYSNFDATTLAGDWELVSSASQGAGGINLIKATRTNDYNVHSGSYNSLSFNRVDKVTDSAVLKQKVGDDTCFIAMVSGFYEAYIDLNTTGSVYSAISINSIVDDESEREITGSLSTRIGFSGDLNAGDEIRFVFKTPSSGYIFDYGKFVIKRLND